jgi:hypothetical protein
MTRLYDLPGAADLVNEYLRRPAGPHSPELRAFIRKLQGASTSRGTIIVSLVPFRLWALATLPQDRSQRITIERDRLFECEDDASRALFLRQLELQRAPPGA